MMIQTVTQSAHAAIHGLHIVTRTAEPNIIVAPEGSELASQLRADGWIARSGWRSHAAGRPTIWLVRFEYPLASVTEAVA